MSDSTAFPAADQPPEAPPALIARVGGAVVARGDGELAELGLAAVRRLVQERPVLVAHGPATAARLGVALARAYDVLELFAFVRPAQFCIPTAGGLAQALGLPPPGDAFDEAMILQRAARLLLRDLAVEKSPARAARIAFTMGQAGWLWAPVVLRALGRRDGGEGRGSGLDVWSALPEWDEAPPRPPPPGLAVSGAEARAALANLLGPGAETRPDQAAYAAAVAEAFAPREAAGMPRLVLAEAGTGIGKTLGYIAPAAVWAAKNGAAVWLSTFTKNLQRQLDRELDSLYPDLRVKARKAVIRKGRENYLCLLNLEERAGQGGGQVRPDAVALGLVARWALASRDGDMVGGDFPGWASELVAAARPRDLTDRRGECIHSACPHYRKCFVERARVKARGAEIVVANHALVMVHAAGAGDPRELPTRYVFDEGHHIFDAADGAFAAHFSGLETAELRRWARGAEAGHRRAGRGRGLERRLEDLAAPDPATAAALKAVVQAAGQLPGDGWAQRIAEGGAMGPIERFLAAARRFVLARSDDRATGFDLEALPVDLPGELIEAGFAAQAALHQLGTPAAALSAGLAARLADEAETLETAERLRLEAAQRSLDQRLVKPVTAWAAMLGGLGRAVPVEFVDWFAIARHDGRELDVGLFRHWLDPTRPLAAVVLERAHGVAVTSATLRDSASDAEDWQAAEIRTGASHLVLPARRASFSSPFDFRAQARVLIVTDVRRNQPDEVAAAYRALFQAAGGGALGLFTAIERLRAVHRRILAPLDQAGLRLYAQHVDPMDVSTLIDIFRAEDHACLLGTDAVRDGVDVPGRSLRLIVFDRVPWPRPGLLHRARKEAFGGTAYDDMLVRLKLRQAFGRLIRKADDRGVFVLLDAMTPSRFLSAFPGQVEVARVGLAEAVAATADFLGDLSAGG